MSDLILPPGSINNLPAAASRLLGLPHRLRYELGPLLRGVDYDPLRPLADAFPSFERSGFRLSAPEYQALREHALGSWKLVGIVSPGKIERASDAFRDAAYPENFDERTIRLLFGVMLDGLPTARAFSSSEMYVNAAIEVLRDGGGPVSASALYAVVLAVWREQTFVPAIAEIVKLTNAEMEKCADAFERLDRLNDARSLTAFVLVTTGDLQQKHLPDWLKPDDNEIPF